LYIQFISNWKKGLLLVLSFIFIMSLSAQTISRAALILQSAVVPGLGQLELKENRGYVFLANDVMLISGLYYFNNEADLKLTKANDIALKFAHITPGSHSDDYLVKIGKYTSNGFDVNGWNTYVHEQAVTQFPGNPTAQQEYFDQNMIPDTQGWNWDSNDQRQNYRKVRKESLDLKDYAKVVTGMIIANHIINVIDIARTTAHHDKLKVGFGMSPDLKPQLQFALEY
jgi:hypothetical protein